MKYSNGPRRYVQITSPFIRSSDIFVFIFFYSLFTFSYLQSREAYCLYIIYKILYIQHEGRDNNYEHSVHIRLIYRPVIICLMSVKTAIFLVLENNRNTVRCIFAIIQYIFGIWKKSLKIILKVQNQSSLFKFIDFKYRVQFCL